MATTDFNIYFPANNLNPQGWISEFITPVLSRTGVNRSDEANLFYDDLLTQQNKDNLKKAGFTEEEIDKFVLLRSGYSFLEINGHKSYVREGGENKLLFLNGNYLDLLEVDANYRDSILENRDLIKYITFMSQIKPYQQAFLQPYIRLQYGVRRNKKEDYTWYDFPFKQKFDLDFILSSGRPRTEGAGIVSVDVENKFNIATYINSNISIEFFFGNLKLLTQEMDQFGNPSNKKNNESLFPFGFNFAKLVENLDIKTQAIRLEYGRKVATGFEDIVVAGESLSGMKSIIEEREKRVILLNKTSHDFEFKESGEVTLSVNYMNFHDVSMKSPNNIIVPGKTSPNITKLKLKQKYGTLVDSYNKYKEEIQLLEEKLVDIKKVDEAVVVDKINSEQKNLQIKDLQTKLENLNKNFNLIKRSIKPSISNLLLDIIRNNGQLFGINFNTKQNGKIFNVVSEIFLVSPFQKDNGDFRTIFTYTKSYDTNKFLENAKTPNLFGGSELVKKDLLTRTYARIFNSPYTGIDPKDKKYGNIMFFPLKALIQAAYSMLDTDERDRIPHMLFGSVLLKVGNEMCSVNVGDLLIEVGVFQKWYYEKVLKKDRLEYAFGSFMMDIMTDLVPEALYRNRVGFDDKAPTTALKEVQYYLKSSPSEDLIRDIYIQNDLNRLKEFTNLLVRNAPLKKIKPLIYYGQLNNQTTQVPSPLFANLGISEFKLNEIEDAAKGIPHIKIGADGGFFTSVSFNKTDFPLIRTALTLESLADKASRYFFAYYQLTINMMGTNMFNYDSVVCVPANPLGINTEENDIGIVGYYKVKSTTDSLDSDNNYTTTAIADWVFNPRQQNREKQKDSSGPYSDRVITDKISLAITNPENYVIEFLENDPNTIIALQAQKMQPPKKKTKEEAKKEKEKPKKEKVIRDV